MAFHHSIFTRLIGLSRGNILHTDREVQHKERELASVDRVAILIYVQEYFSSV